MGCRLLLLRLDSVDCLIDSPPPVEDLFRQPLFVMVPLGSTGCCWLPCINATFTCHVEIHVGVDSVPTASCEAPRLLHVVDMHRLCELSELIGSAARPCPSQWVGEDVVGHFDRDHEAMVCIGCAELRLW